MSYLTTKQASEILGVSERHVRLLIAREKLKAERFGTVWMIKESDIGKAEVYGKRGRPPKEEAKAKSAKSSKRSFKPAKKSRKAKAGMNHAGEIEEEETGSEEIAAKKGPATKPDPEAGKSAKKRGGAGK